MITVLPNTNIYQYQNKNDNEPKIETLSQSTNYYLNKVKLKTANHDYSYFIDIYNENSKIKGLTQSFFIFTELIQYFEFNELHITYKNNEPDWGIIQAFYKRNNLTVFDIIPNKSLPPELSDIKIKFNDGENDWITVPRVNNMDATCNSNFLPILLSPK